MRKIVTIVCLILLICMLSAPGQWASAKPRKDRRYVELTDSDRGPDHKRPSSRKAGTNAPAPRELAPTDKRNDRDAAAFKAAMRRYESQIQRYSVCVAAGDVASCPAPPNRPDAPNFGRSDVIIDTPDVPAITGEQAAYMAFARLTLVPPKPVIGPSPDSNPWKMAAVGYPLWLSIDGDPTPPAVSDAVATVHVRLEARVSKVVFHMGDRHSVSCTKLTTTWTRSARGKQSSDCGYTYQKPSLPKGNYTVTATTYWSVAWSTSQDSGTIPFIQSNSTQLPVGELQVLTR